MIQVRDLTYRYPDADETVIKGLNFIIDEGEIFGFLGPSGAGKSTTQKIIYRILNGYKGDISINNKPLDLWGKEYFEKIVSLYKIDDSTNNANQKEQLLKHIEQVENNYQYLSSKYKLPVEIYNYDQNLIMIYQ